MPSEKIIALMTDFGNDDPFVGIMKGVIANISPQAKLIDITHNIPPGDIRRAAVMLWQSRSYFPPGTIFLTVVDPGVGTLRKGIIAQSKEYIFVGPDNGVFSFLGDDLTAWELTAVQFQLSGKGQTFHGRDVFAPAAAYAANGIESQQFGAQSEELILLAGPKLIYTRELLIGETLHSDKFGNVLTSLGRFIQANEREYLLDPWIHEKKNGIPKSSISKDKSTLILPDNKILFWIDTFADLPKSECGFLVGSSGLIEIVANRNSASKLLKLNSGNQLVLKF